MIYSVYFIIFALLGLYNWLKPTESSKKMTALMVLPFIMLIVQDGFRWEIGTDWEPYYTFFENVNILGDDTEFEIGYVYLNEFISSIGGNYTLFLIGKPSANCV